MSARWEDGTGYGAAERHDPEWREGGVLRGVVFALVVEVGFVVVCLILLALLFSSRTEPGRLGPAWNLPEPVQPSVYVECVLNRHVSDICLGA